MYNKKLLSFNNAKTVKGEKYGFKTYILYMSPHTQNSQAKNVCPNASQGCADACLYKSGFGGIYTSVQQGRIAKTELFLNDRKFFLDYLKAEITKVKAKHDKKGENLCIRLNGTSDLAYETFKIEGKSLIEHFPTIQFYDYTKSPKRMTKYLKGELPSNYQLTFSRSEVNDIESEVVLGNGGNVAMVFRNGLPTTYKGFKVVDGDESDLRFLDDNNVVVGLKYKNITGSGGKETNDASKESGFVIDSKVLEGELVK
jgi:hypothetical protein